MQCPSSPDHSIRSSVLSSGLGIKIIFRILYILNIDESSKQLKIKNSMNAVTYSLKPEGTNSEIYYNDVRRFAGRVLTHCNESIKPIADEYISYLDTYKLEKIRAIEEYILELLSFGVLWKTYAHSALAVQRAPFITMAKMAEWRKKHRRLKPYIDFARGIFLTLYFIPEKRTFATAPAPALEQIDHVCKWFEATGEFKEQALRFIRWRAFWAEKNQTELLKIFSAIEAFTAWFDQNSLAALGKYTQHVESFLADSNKRYRWREDRISSTRSRLEYHLNMVGAELMNCAFRAEYKNTQSKAVLLPGCMRGRPNNECKAQRVQEGLICKGCYESCRVNQIREMGKRNNFNVYIIPHASDLSLWSPKPGQPTTGIIASACVTTLVEGGWELKRYDVPAQCVLLDYSGCFKHWGCNGVSTELNIRELKRILN